MSTAIVTGGAGFIGSNLTDALIAEGATVHVVDNLSNGTRDKLHPDAVFHEMDIRDADALKALAAEIRPDTVFHLAAQADVRKALENPGYDADVNVIGTVNVLEAARAAGARVVFASTGGAGYGEYPELPVPSPETSDTRPMSHYGMSKMAGEGYCRLYARLYGSDAVVLRLGNVYGPRQDPHGEAGVVAIFAGRLLADEACTIYGDGEQTRDYVYVDDVVDAFVRAADKGGGLVINIGTGVETSVNQLYSTMADVAGIERAAVLAPARDGEVPRSALDAARAEMQLGWKPWTDLATGSAAVLEYFRKKP